jgi:hypothetical protein
MRDKLKLSDGKLDKFLNLNQKFLTKILIITDLS